MKNIYVILILMLSFQMMAQNKKMEITNNSNGKTVIIEESQNVKIATIDREKYTGNITFIDAETISLQGQNIKLDNVNSIKNVGGKKITTKKIIMSVGLGLVATSGIMAATSNGNAFSFFAVGTSTAIVGGLLNDKNKNYSKRKYTFKIIP